MNHEQQIEDLQRELIRVERENRILWEANAVAGERIRELSNCPWLLILLGGALGFIAGAIAKGGFPWS